MMKPSRAEIPVKGYDADRMLSHLNSCKAGDVRWDQGRVFGFVYHAGEAAAQVAETYLRAFLYENTLNPATFPSLRRFEKEVVEMSAGLMHGNRLVAGSMTSGGTESIFLALKVAREQAKESVHAHPPFEVILPETAHPAFLKACDYLSLKPVLVPAGKDGRADPLAMENAITPRSILLVCSAPCFPYGQVDPVESVGRIARKHRLLFHVDACLGGFILPFLEELGYPMPRFDFRVPGVTSISMDAHKYGYAPKGCSIVLYRSRSLRKKQFFVHTDWPGGIFASTTFMGTRSGGPMAGCWAIMNHLGKEGYMELARRTMETTLRLVRGIEATEGLELIAKPVMPVLAFTSRRYNIQQIGDALSTRGWHLDRLQFPDALHMTITQVHEGKEDLFLQDLREIVNDVASLKKQSRKAGQSARWIRWIMQLVPAGTTGWIARKAGASVVSSERESKGNQAAIYGLSSSISDRREMKKFVVNLLDGMY